MSDRIRYALGQSSLGDERFPAVIIEEDAAGLATTVATLVRVVDHPKMGAHRDARDAKAGNTLAILSSSYRVVKKDGLLSGARACAASLRAASRGVQPRIPRTP
jgi:hypothetical protein